ncbi:MAG: class I SAM-dependent methyltransferase [Candidatus Vecturithrix sp.]|jgi:ubiquinone/menaquinone biosynthesis C-methylase UbiE|nr:class I SAM-dependent methyltransferase [Candidatus Vecturithrix sp.]
MKTENQLQEIDTQNRVSQQYDSERYGWPHSRMYHAWWAADMVGATLDEGVWLDLGCGTGLIHEVMQRKGCHRQLVGIDISHGMLRFARQKQMTVVMGDAENLPFKSNSFDGILGKGVLHHLSDMGSSVSELYRVLKPGGFLILTDPNLSPLRALKFMLMHKEKHYSPLHHSMHPIAYIRRFKSKFDIIDFKYFGFFAYPVAFPDILPYTVSEKCMERLMRFDEIISRIPILNRLCWAFKLTARKAKT